MRNVYSGVFWVSVYLVLVLLPLAALLVGREAAGNGFWWDFSLALGFSGTAMIGTLFLQTARFRRVSAPFGIDIIYYFHRQSSLIAFSFIFVHPFMLIMVEPGLSELLVPTPDNWPMWTGVFSLLALVMIMATSLWRKQLQFNYDYWRIAHAVLAVLALALATLHILGVGQYVDAPWKKVAWGGLAAAWLWLLFYVRVVRPLWLVRHPYRVTAVREERGDAWTLELVPEGHHGFDFLPGQFAWLTIGNSPFALKEHPFSIASSAENAVELSFTIKALGDFTIRTKDVAIWQTVYVDGPYGSFSPDREPASSYIFIAGGIGIAPIMGMLRTLGDRNDATQIVLFYAYSTWERLTFREELNELQQRLNLRVVYVLNNPADDWQGESGLISGDILSRHLPDKWAEAECFVCGPVPMLNLAERLLKEIGYPLKKIHSELFDLV